MSEPPVRLDPADAVPPGERAALADTARHLVDERADLAHTAQDLVGERAGLAHTAQDLVGERARLAETAKDVAESNIALAKTVQSLTERIKSRTRLFTALLIADAILTFAIAFFGYRYETVSACQAAQNDAFTSAIIQRNDAAVKERTAQRKLFDVLMKPTSTIDQRQAASAEYYAGLIAADQQRNAHPLPTGNCG